MAMASISFLSRSTPLKRKPPYFWFITTSPKRRNHSIVLIGSNVKGSQFHFKKEFLTEVLDYEYDKSIRAVSTSTLPSLFDRLVHRTKGSIGFLFKIGRLSFLLRKTNKNLIILKYTPKNNFGTILLYYLDCRLKKQTLNKISGGITVDRQECGSDRSQNFNFLTIATCFPSLNM